MPVRLSKRRVTVETGFTCDRCGAAHADVGSCVRIQHRFSHGTPLDGSDLDAALCEMCASVLFSDLINGPRATDASDGLRAVAAPAAAPATAKARRAHIGHLVDSLENQNRDFRLSQRSILAHLRQLDPEVVDAALDLFDNDEDGAAAYLCTRGIAFRGETPLAMLARGKRRDVLAAIHRLIHGIPM